MIAEYLTSWMNRREQERPVSSWPEQLRQAGQFLEVSCHYCRLVARAAEYGIESARVAWPDEYQTLQHVVGFSDEEFREHVQYVSGLKVWEWAGIQFKPYDRAILEPESSD